MSDDRRRKERSLRVFRVLRWIMLPVGVLGVVFGISELVDDRTWPGVLNTFLGVVFIAQGISYFYYVRVLRQQLAVGPDSLEV